jgi:GDP-L-fucose synthase
MQSHINVGCGKDITINELAHAIANATGYVGKISFDPTKPDGSPRKWMDSGKLNRLGWAPRVQLELGLAQAYEAFIQS